MITYKVQGLPNQQPIAILSSDGLSIPFDPANVDFQQYQVWLSEGNVPTPADEPTLP